VIGGIGSSGALKSVEVYDPATDRWTSGPDLPENRSGLAAVTDADGHLYVVGGRGGESGNPLDEVLVLDPAGGAWSAVASLPTPRASLAAALGSDRRIYALGGSVSTVLGTVEAYDPQDNTWSTVASLPTPRELLAAATAGDGRIYAIGGFDVRELATVEAYAPKSDRWTPVAWVSPGRVGPSAAAQDGRILVTGGENFGMPVGSRVDGYSAATNAWISQPSLMLARKQGAAVTGPDGRIYAIGGISPEQAVLGSVEAFRPTAPTRIAIDIQPGDPANQIDLESASYVRVGLLSSPTFDPKVVDGASVVFASASPLPLRSGSHQRRYAYDERNRRGPDRDLNGDKKRDRIFRFQVGELNLTEGQTQACLAGRFTKGSSEFEACGPVQTSGTPRTWSPIAPMNEARIQGAMVADASGRVYAIGGWTAAQKLQANVERYDPVLDQWSQVAPLPLAQSGHAAVLGTDGLIYVAGGFNGTNALASTQAYDPVGNAWTLLAPMAQPRDEVAGASGADGRIYVFGGHDEEVVTESAEVYNPRSRRWTSIAAMPAPRFGHTAVRAPNGEIYVIGGLASLDATGPENTVWAYDPVGDQWRTLASLPARFGAAAVGDANGLIYLLGGDDGTVTLNTVYAYDPARNVWTQVASMGTPREGHGAALAADGRIIVAGGYDGAVFTRTAEAFGRP